MTHDLALSRRRFLAAAALTTGSVMAVDMLGGGTAEAQDVVRWSDASAWTDGVPASGSPVSITRPVLLDVDVEVASLVVEVGAALYFDPSSSRTLTSRGNVEVRGLLQMRPAHAGVDHLVRFIGIDEKRFVGGGMEVIATDVGLWASGTGKLDFAGTARTAWVRASESVPAGTRTITLASAPTGWQVGDDVVVTPTGAPDGRTVHFDAYDTATISAISGRTLTLASATRFAHPVVQVAPDVRLGPEVMNLTRNVRIEGTPGGRAHFTVLSKQVQDIAYTAVRHVGPRQPFGAYTKGVLGRYGLHFHMCGDASRGSRVTGVVVRDSGSHAFVPHLSNGITFNGCISHNTLDEAYWWDMNFGRGGAIPSNDIEYRSCIASRVNNDPEFRGYRLAGFVLPAGTGNKAVDCVAVGVRGNGDAAGFLWPESAGTGVWQFTGCIAHNNKRNGIFVWQNSWEVHRVEAFAMYHNGGVGVSHGAYVNLYQYVDGIVYGNWEGGVDLHAVSRGDTWAQPLRLVNLRIDGAGFSPAAVKLSKHTAKPGRATEVIGCEFVRHRGPAVLAVYAGGNGGSTEDRLDLIDCKTDGQLLRLLSVMPAATLVRVQDGTGALAARIPGQVGVFRPDWNASVSTLTPFNSAPRVASRDVTFRTGSDAALVAGVAALLKAGGRAGALPAVPSPRHGSTIAPLDVRIEGRGTATRLVVVNHDPRPCTATVHVGNRRRQLVFGRGTTTLPLRVRPSEVEVRCHEGAFSWPKTPGTA